VENDLAGYDVGIGRQESAQQGRPKALGETEGFVELVTGAAPTNCSEPISSAKTEIVHELVLAIELGATANGTANTMHIHPTLPNSIDPAAGGVHEPS